MRRFYVKYGGNAHQCVVIKHKGIAGSDNLVKVTEEDERSTLGYADGSSTSGEAAAGIHHGG